MADTALVLTPAVTGGVAVDLFAGRSGDGAYVRNDDDAIALPVVSYDEEYADSPDTEGGQRVRSRPERVTGHVDLFVKGSTSAAMWAAYKLIEQTVEQVRRNKGTLAYTPANGVAVTYNVESARMSEVPQDGVLIGQGRLACQIEFTFQPYGQLATQSSYPLSDLDPFNRDTITNQEWRYDNGSGTLSVSGGVLVPSSTALKTIWRNLKVTDATGYVKFTTGASVAATWTAGLIMKRLDASNYLLLDGADTVLRIGKVDGGAFSSLATTTISLATNTSYWVKGVIAGNVITVTLYSTDPNGSNPTAALYTTTYTLAGANATKFGSGVKGNPGIGFTPKATDWRMDDWRLDATTIESSDPLFSAALFSVPGSVSALLNAKIEDRANQARSHIEIGITDKEFDPTSVQPILLDSDALSTTGYAGSATTRAGTNEVQTVTITGTPTGGTFTLTYEGQTTAAIAYNANAAAVATALNALTNISAGGSVSTGGGALPGTPVTVTFGGGNLTQRDITQMTATGSFTGGSSPAVAVTTTTAGVAGAYDPGAAGNSVIRATLVPTYSAVCGQSSLGHRGTWRVKVRYVARDSGNTTYAGGTVYQRIAWRVADGDWQRNDWATGPNLGGFAEANLGLVTIPDALIGSQSWEFKIEAYTGTPGDLYEVDYVEFIPARRYAKITGSSTSEPSGGVVGYDRFNQTAGNLTGKTADVGGVWTVGAAGASTAEDGDTDDFTLDATNHWIQRAIGADSSLTNGRYVSNGTTSQTGVDVQADISQGVQVAPNSGNELRTGVYARFVDTDNWLMAVRKHVGIPLDEIGAATQVALIKRVAGTVTTLASVQLSSIQDANWYTLKLSVPTAAGVITVYGGSQGGSLTSLLTYNATSDTHFDATTGALRTGKVGVYDAINYSPSPTLTRAIDNFSASTLSATTTSIRPAINAGGSVYARHDAVYRDSGGSPLYEGSRLRVDPAGREGRAARLVVKARRNNVDTLADDQIADATALTVDVTPRVALLSG